MSDYINKYREVESTQEPFGEGGFNDCCSDDGASFNDIIMPEKSLVNKIRVYYYPKLHRRSKKTAAVTLTYVIESNLHFSEKYDSRHFKKHCKTIGFDEFDCMSAYYIETKNLIVGFDDDRPERTVKELADFERKINYTINEIYGFLGLTEVGEKTIPLDLTDNDFSLRRNLYF